MNKLELHGVPYAFNSCSAFIISLLAEEVKEKRMTLEMRIQPHKLRQMEYLSSALVLFFKA